jgi:hypothetical protein
MNNFANSSAFVFDRDPVKVEVHALFEIRGYDDEQVETYFVTTHMLIGTCWDDEVPQLLENLRQQVEEEYSGYYAVLLWKWVTTA